MDITALQKMIASDVAAVRTPLIVIGDVGASICGHVDNIQRLQEVCRANSIWLHCRGHSLAALAVTQGALLPRSDGQPFTAIADSISLTLGNWLALPNLPVVVSAANAQPCRISIDSFDLHCSYYIGKLKMFRWR